MTRNLFNAQFLFVVFTAVFCLQIGGCATHKADPQNQINHSPTQWDYKKIEEAREAESAQTPAQTAPRDDSMCQVMTHSEMIRAKTHGCRKLDPRLGHGEDSYCCPKDQ